MFPIGNRTRYSHGNIRINRIIASEISYLISLLLQKPDDNLLLAFSVGVTANCNRMHIYAAAPFQISSDVCKGSAN